MPIQFEIKSFKELTTKQLYQLLHLRNEVFVVEQNCIYQDVDNKDQKAIHILGYLNGKLIAYARIFKPDDYFKQASIGRVVVDQKYRNNGYGYPLMETAIVAIKKFYNQETIAISAQEHLKRFYSNLGFIQEGNSYLEDGIPHIFMLKK